MFSCCADLMLFILWSLCFISFMIRHMAKRLKSSYCFWLFFLLLSCKKDEKCLYFFVKKLSFKNLFPVIRNMRKLRPVRLTAVALGEILGYSTLVLLADYVTSTTLNSKIKYIPLEVPISFSYHVWMILFTTTFIFGLLIVVVLFLNERK